MVKEHNKVLDAFLALTQALTVLAENVRQDSDIIAWVQADYAPDITVVREKALSVLNQLFYLPQQTPREIIICAGFVGSSHDTLLAAHHVNQCKENFKQTMLELKALKTSVQEHHLLSSFNEIVMRSKNTSSVLHSAGLSRLHLKQCYRKIPILDYAPSKISWTWAHTRSIKKITLKTAESMLLKRGNDEGIHIQLAKLGMLSPNEHLAIVQELAPHLRANIVFKQPDGSKRLMIKGPIPIFFPADLTTPCPQFSPPEKKCEKDRSRMIRSDVKLDTEVYLPAIRAHRYIR